MADEPVFHPLQQQGRLARQQVAGVDGIDRLVLDLLDEFEPGLAAPETAEHPVGKRDLHEDQPSHYLGAGPTRGVRPEARVMSGILSRTLSPTRPLSPAIMRWCASIPPSRPRGCAVYGDAPDPLLLGQRVVAILESGLRTATY